MKQSSNLSEKNALQNKMTYLFRMNFDVDWEYWIKKNNKYLRYCYLSFSRNGFFSPKSTSTYLRFPGVDIEFWHNQ